MTHKFHYAGLQGYFGSSSGAMPPMGGETGDSLYLLAKKMSLERQKSLPNHYPPWPGRDATSTVAKPDPLMQHSNLLPSVAENSRQQLHPQNADLMSILQGLSDRSGVNNGANGWSNFPIQSGLDPVQDSKLDMHHGQNIPHQAAFGGQQQRLQPNQPSITHLLSQGINSTSGALTPEKLLSSGLSQDPQVLSLLQQQYLLQLQTQAPVPSQQLSLLDKLLLLKQQQKQEEQQQILRQQQQLLSQVISEQHSHQRFAEPAYGQLQTAGLPVGNASLDHPRFQSSHDLFQTGSAVQVPTMQDERVTNFVSLPPRVSQDISHDAGSEASSIHLPHQMFGSSVYQNSWGATLPEQIDDFQQKASSEMMSSSPQSEVVDKFLQEQASLLNLGTNDHLGKPVTVQPVGAGMDEVSVPEKVNDSKVLPPNLVEEPQVGREESNDGVKDVKAIEGREVRKSSEKKSKKQKSSKSLSSDTAKGAVSKTKQSKQLVTEETHVIDPKSDMHVVSGEMAIGALQEAIESKSGTVTVENVDLQEGKSSLPAQMYRDDGETVGNKSDSQVNTEVLTGQRAWKPAPGFKPKSLLEIQQEEQRKAQIAMSVSEISTSVGSMNVSTPWAGVVSNSEYKSSWDSQQDVGSTESRKVELEGPPNQKSKKSQLHDLLADEVLAKSSGREIEVPDGIYSLPPLPVVSSQSDPAVDDNFIEAKETKKNRKKSAKAKTAGARTQVQVSSVDVSVGSSPIDKSRGSRLSQHEEVLPAVPSGPSLGDFVVWKGETTNTSPAPAWSNDSAKLAKATSLRDIQKEQGKNVSSGQHQNLMPVPQKSLPTQPPRGSGPSWSASPPSKAASPLQVVPQVSSQSKHKVDDDFFWGPADHPKQEAKQSDFPRLANQGSFGKNTPVKGTSGGSLSRQKSTSGRAAEHALSTSPAPAHSSLRGKKDASTKHSEAVDFRIWCESECVRLIGTKDTSILEFCLKQSTSEAEELLRENLGSFDPDHKFIDKFLNYKDFLPTDILEVAFQSQNDQKVTGYGPGDVNSVDEGIWGSDQGNASKTDGSTKGGGKKKGKKGKKVSPSALGFNVVSNRIMMGEIQTLDD
ncbi:hypothetical protein RJ640_020995 [Escallonia rubra]|uniref:GYF domain-containing protein n=1 Tax=Escallonia rubra TaxID=112253 RepID=A0AA88RT88_9ASTE|nr:hypothetical protein RJ640_020995 [Escallonia rubra]